MIHNSFDEQFLKNYLPATRDLWQGRQDASSPSRLHETIQLIDIAKNSSELKKGSIGFIGFASDEGIRRNQGRVGAAEGVNALRRALANLPLLNGRFNFADVGTIVCQDGNLEEAQSQLAKAIQQLLSNHLFPIVLGGGHELAWGHFQGIARAYPNKKITIINFDSHFDLRPLTSDGKGTSGTSFTQISQLCPIFDYHCLGIQRISNTAQMFETAAALGVKYVSAEEFHLGGPELPLDFLDSILLKSDAIYLTICLDVFASAFAPGVSAPQPLGLLPWQVIPLLQRLAASRKVISMDIAELSPPLDIECRTAHLASGLVYHFLDRLIV